MSLRDRLEGKERRRTTVRVVVDAHAAGAAALRAHQAQATVDALGLAPDPDAGLLAAARADADAARAALDACFETVEFTALDPDVYEALLADHVGDDGDLDEAAALPVLAAACAVDEDLRDEAWWTDQLASGKWNAGERDQLLTELVALNYAVPGPGPGKG